jgi:hypothetical protein
LSKNLPAWIYAGTPQKDKIMSDKFESFHKSNQALVDEVSKALASEVTTIDSQEWKAIAAKYFRDSNSDSNAHGANSGMDKLKNRLPEKATEKQSEDFDKAFAQASKGKSLNQEEQKLLKEIAKDLKEGDYQALAKLANAIYNDKNLLAVFKEGMKALGHEVDVTHSARPVPPGYLIIPQQETCLTIKTADKHETIRVGASCNDGGPRYWVEKTSDDKQLSGAQFFFIPKPEVR